MTNSLEHVEPDTNYRVYVNRFNEVEDEED